MNSRLYECQVMHQRLAPQRYGFVHRVFMFYLDLDELDMLSRRLRWFSRGRFNLYSFRDGDHLHNGARDVKQSLLPWLAERGVETKGLRLMLLTHVRMLGYVFNPVSFYFCFDAADCPVCVVAEVSNTFGEMKPYFLGADCWRENAFRLRTDKHFYISPFIDLTAQVDFNLEIPDAELRLRLDDYVAGEEGARRLLATSLTGKSLPLTDGMLMRQALCYPLLTLRVIALIHWHALVLWVRGAAWLRKADHPELQTGHYRGGQIHEPPDK
ncbi:MAG: DUF1365 domain-containing protein [Blastocatellia bacterium]